MRSDAATVPEYLEELPAERGEALATVRRTILEHLPDGYEEVMNWGMITYQVPLQTFSDTYNGRPLMYAALASQKHHMALYLTAVYAVPDTAERFAEAYRATGKRLDMGKSCVRFRSLDELPLELIGETIASVPVVEFIALASRR
jgi:uncharacterized protein YdhG (YjbR/CyaY superfamily)